MTATLPRPPLARQELWLRVKVGLLRTAVTLAMSAAIVLIVAKPSRADERLAWIHKHRPDCCDHRDCAPAKVAMTFIGWQVEGARNVIPFARVIRWPFAVPYACIAAHHARCLFMDAGG